MRIYFSGAISGGRHNLLVYQHIVERLLQSVSKMITGNPAPNLTVATYQDLEELDAHLDSFIKSLQVRCDG